MANSQLPSSKTQTWTQEEIALTRRAWLMHDLDQIQNGRVNAFRRAVFAAFIVLMIIPILGAVL